MCGNTYYYERVEAARRYERELAEKREQEARVKAEQDAREKAASDTKAELDRISNDVDALLNRMPVGALAARA